MTLLKKDITKSGDTTWVELFFGLPNMVEKKGIITRLYHRKILILFQISVLMIAQNRFENHLYHTIPFSLLVILCPKFISQLHHMIITIQNIHFVQMKIVKKNDLLLIWLKLCYLLLLQSLNLL